jgi:hypothetical protein
MYDYCKFIDVLKDAGLFDGLSAGSNLPSTSRVGAKLKYPK